MTWVALDVLDLDVWQHITAKMASRNDPVLTNPYTKNITASTFTALTYSISLIAWAIT